MTISGLYRDNGNNADFWVQHRQWHDVCGHVCSIAGKRKGPLPSESAGDDNGSVVLVSYDVSSGRPSTAPFMNLPKDRNYRRIADPPWARGINSAPIKAVANTVAKPTVTKQ